jgi:hypothetical protein
MGRDKKGKLQKKPPLNSNLTGKEAMRKKFSDRKKLQTRGKQIITTSTQLTIVDGVSRLLLP